MPTHEELEQQRCLERAADRLLHQDAVDRGFIAPSGRGFTKYERSIGITSDSGLRRVHLHEAIGFSEEDLDHLAHESPTDAIRRRKGEA